MSKSFKNSLVSVIAASLTVLGATLAQAQSIGPGVVTERPLYQQAADEIQSYHWGKVADRVISNEIASPDTELAMDLLESTRMLFAQARAAGTFTLKSPVQPNTGPEGAPYNWVFSTGTQICTMDAGFSVSKGFRPKLASPVMEGGTACFAVRVLPPLPWLPKQGQ